MTRATTHGHVTIRNEHSHTCHSCVLGLDVVPEDTSTRGFASNHQSSDCRTAMLSTHPLSPTAGVIKMTDQV